VQERKFICTGEDAVGGYTNRTSSAEHTHTHCSIDMGETNGDQI
jgi:hypothetical protein